MRIIAFREIGMDMNLKWKKSSIFGLSKTSKIGTSFQVRLFTLYRMLTYIDLYAVEQQQQQQQQATSEPYVYPSKTTVHKIQGKPCQLVRY